MTLRPWPVEVARQLVAGAAPALTDCADWHPDYPLPETVGALRLLLEAHELMGTLADLPRWWTHEIRVAGQVVGDIGFHGPPEDDGPVVVEIGYAVVPALRGRGVASRACALLLERAWRDGAERVLADADADNLASRAVLARNGFRQRLCGDFVAQRPAEGRG